MSWSLEGRERQVDTYIKINLPYPDARVASILTGPRGPCKYAVKGGMQISDEVIRSLVRKINSAFGGDIASVLVLPLLWAAYEENMTVNGYTLPIIPPSLTSAIKERWIAAGNSPVENPIEKISLGVQQFGDQLVIVPIRHPGKENGVVAARTDGEEEEHAGADGGVAPATNAGSEGYWAGKSEVELLFLQQFQMQQRIEDLREEMNNLFTVQKLYLQNMNTNVKRIAAQPVVHSYPVQRQMSGHTTAGLHGSLNLEATTMEELTTREEAMTAEAMTARMRHGMRTGSDLLLFKNPKDLYFVCKEWEFGVNGVKPARDFTPRERGANKLTYCQCKLFWDAGIRMISHGFISNFAINRIYLVYGWGKPVPYILKALADDKRNGTDRLL